MLLSLFITFLLCWQGLVRLRTLVAQRGDHQHTDHPRRTLLVAATLLSGCSWFLAGAFWSGGGLGFSDGVRTVLISLSLGGFAAAWGMRMYVKRLSP